MSNSKRHTCASCGRKRDEYYMNIAQARSNNGLPKWTCRDNHYGSRKCTEKFKLTLTPAAASVRVNSDIIPGQAKIKNQIDLVDLINEVKSNY